MSVVRTFKSECETGWTRLGDNCYKSLGTDISGAMAQDMCMEDDSNLFYPQSREELQWIKSMLTGTQKCFIGFKGYKNRVIFNMDNSENVGFRDYTRKNVSQSQNLPNGFYR